MDLKDQKMMVQFLSPFPAFGNLAQEMTILLKPGCEDLPAGSGALKVKTLRLVHFQLIFSFWCWQTILVQLKRQ